MSERNVPWPVWAFVTLSAAAITGFFAQSGVTPKPFEPGPPQPPATDSPVSQPARALENVVVHNQLGANQVSEQVTLLVNGRVAGTLVVDQQNPRADLRLDLPSAGTYSYTAQAQAWFRDAYGQMVQGVGAGQGQIDVAAGKHFDLVGSWSGNTWLISLVEESQ